MPDDSTLALRRQVSRQSQLVGQRTALKNEVHALLAAHLIERCPANDLFGRKGRAWLSAQPLSMDEGRGVSNACGNWTVVAGCLAGAHCSFALIRLNRFSLRIP
jgi:transposase